MKGRHESRRGGEQRSPEFRAVSSRNLVQLILGALNGRHAGARGDFAEKSFQSGWGDNPQQQQLALGVLKTVPRGLRNEDRHAFLDRMRPVLEDEGPAAVDDIESLVHLEMPVNRDSDIGQDLLRPEREPASASRGIGLDEDIAAALNEMLPLIGSKHIALWRCALRVNQRRTNGVTGRDSGGAGEDCATMNAIGNHDDRSCFDESAMSSSSARVLRPGSRAFAKPRGKIA